MFTIVVLLLLLVLASAGWAAWLVHRRRQLEVWHVELDAAFDADHVRELPRPRAL